LDDEFLEYCRLNNIDDVEQLAKDVFRRGFTLLKYGSKPTYDSINDYFIPKDNKIPTESQKQDATETLTADKVDMSVHPISVQETTKKDIYDE